LPTALSRLQSLLERGLSDTADLWPDVRGGYRGVHQVAHVLSNHDQREALTVQRRLGGTLGRNDAVQDGRRDFGTGADALPEGPPQ
jgi:hypothetical protein